MTEKSPSDYSYTFDDDDENTDSRNFIENNKRRCKNCTSDKLIDFTAKDGRSLTRCEVCRHDLCPQCLNVLPESQKRNKVLRTLTCPYCNRQL